MYGQLKVNAALVDPQLTVQVSRLPLEVSYLLLSQILLLLERILHSQLLVENFQEFFAHALGNLSCKVTHSYLVEAVVGV